MLRELIVRLVIGREEKFWNGDFELESYWDNIWNIVLIGLCYWIGF